ncbi:hypothetical protein WK05_10200 [Burkholderia ubonensis]|nr:hypothetical protein WJ80_27045 [Burkholderia ubonensis]KVQ74597.1 hypothetical protein WK05_10200 [Burkholderia ubonensis]KVR20208.1 hypothetical protein WK14_22885 [Burkholderia ubonensis]KVX86998.1 hypothetical protein WL10_20610 [Burkholderia ubonensis]KWD12677.1 hypothetical protein WL61_29890 [Burkholderia ubonensis]
MQHVGDACKALQGKVYPELFEDAKHSFPLHGQDRAGKVVFRKKISRKQLLEFFATFHPCTVVM